MVQGSGCRMGGSGSWVQRSGFRVLVTGFNVFGIMEKKVETIIDY